MCGEILFRFRHRVDCYPFNRHEMMIDLIIYCLPRRKIFRNFSICDFFISALITVGFIGEKLVCLTFVLIFLLFRQTMNLKAWQLNISTFVRRIKIIKCIKRLYVHIGFWIYSPAQSSLVDLYQSKYWCMIWNHCI